MDSHVLRKPLISVCIPAYNRSQFLIPLLDSIISQDFYDYEVIICEDMSPQRNDIENIVKNQYHLVNEIKLYLNHANLGYDANFRELLSKARGKYCFFMGNDDIMAVGALSKVASVVTTHDNIGLILRSYSWFGEDSSKIEQTVRYFSEDRIFPPGSATIGTAYRRCGVLSGYIIEREAAMLAETNEFDGFLYYQMYLAASILSFKRAYYIHDVLTLSRSTESPDFGVNQKEKGVFTPGRYTPEARLHMVKGMLTIAKAVEIKTGIKFYNSVQNDIANYIFPYISDQLNLSPKRYYGLYRKFSQLGLSKYKMFHIHFMLAYILKEPGYNFLTKIIREVMGKSPHIGKLYAGEDVSRN